MSEEPSVEVPRRSSGGAFLVFALAFCASVIGAIWYYFHFQEKPVAVVDKNGFDLSDVDRRSDLSGGSTAAAPERSGLGMIGSIKGMQFGQAEQKGAGASGMASTSSTQITQLVHQTERVIIDQAVEYTRRYPVIRQYGHEWMNYPDLRKLNDDYMRTHDPFAFIKGLAAAPHFGTMVKKYSTEPAVRNFVMDAMKNSPAEAVPTAAEYVGQHDDLRKLADNVGTALGLPPGVLGGSQAPKIDGDKVMRQIQSANPNPAP